MRFLFHTFLGRPAQDIECFDGMPHAMRHLGFNIQKNRQHFKG